MKLLTEEIMAKLPPLGATEHEKDPLVVVKFFAPWTFWTWYATEYGPEGRVFFGFVRGFAGELGYFSLDELESARGPFGLRIERDRYWNPVPLSEVMAGKKVNDERGEERRSL